MTLFNMLGFIEKVKAKAAFAALPGTVKTYYYRGDSACHKSGLVNWLRESTDTLLNPYGRSNHLRPSTAW
jgi:hypothetical protein